MGSRKEQIRALPLAVVSTVVAWGEAARAEDGAPPSFEETTLTGDWDGYRDWLTDRGVTFTITQTSDVLGNPSGGIKTGTAYDGVFQFQGDFDMERLAGWSGAAVHVSGYAIQGRGLSASDIGNLLTVTSVEAEAGVRLGEFYLSQDLLGNALTLKVGQILADQSFAISNTASLFVNSTFGWPGIFASDLPGGGPAYPLATPGVQVIAKPNEAWTFQAALFNGSPTGDSPAGNANGLGFPIGNGVLAIVESSYGYDLDAGAGLAGTLKLGAWYNSEEFDSVLTASNGLPQRLSGNAAIYGVVDQALWREKSGGDVGLDGFARLAMVPRQDRNLINWYFDTGLSYKGPFKGREADVAGIAFAYAHISDDVADLTEATNALDGTSTPVPTSEAVIEITYQAAITPALSVQPFFQYIIRPGGRAADPNRPGSAIPNATVLGLRVAATF
ncbi:carbohydrate porin [Rhizobiaceae bacterium n13]|uniref:Carbohydrate porin n=1 Tax=Ferirhizobium litorale TaxID=2927786 RepID=A0AAE3QKE3_9HYPH|nr:carbohydrate porin [Fererhizobium litorale]MDI7864242.1 carbohydrate porin [Fererhizobium litorale]MDI7925115.1 carbohydrate porin [Fererhizobium litorale]